LFEEIKLLFYLKKLKKNRGNSFSEDLKVKIQFISFFHQLKKEKKTMSESHPDVFYVYFIWFNQENPDFSKLKKQNEEKELEISELRKKLRHQELESLAKIKEVSFE